MTNKPPPPTTCDSWCDSSALALLLLPCHARARRVQKRSSPAQAASRAPLAPLHISRAPRGTIPVPHLVTSTPGAAGGHTLSQGVTGRARHTRPKSGAAHARPSCAMPCTRHSHEGRPPRAHTSIAHTNTRVVQSGRSVRRELARRTCRQASSARLPRATHSAPCTRAQASHRKQRTNNKRQQ